MIGSFSNLSTNKYRIFISSSPQCNESTTTAAKLIEHISVKHGVVLCREVKTLQREQISWHHHLPLQSTEKCKKSQLSRLHPNPLSIQSIHQLICLFLFICIATFTFARTRGLSKPINLKERTYSK